jgi:hypothetical protein
VKRALIVVLALLVLGAVVALAAFSRGRYDHIALGDRASASTRLASICRSRPPRPDRRLLVRCVRVSGTLLDVRRGYDDASRLDEIHLLVAAHFHLFVVKLLPPFPQHLRFGADITAVGPLLETKPSRFGIDEVEAFSFKERH